MTQFPEIGAEDLNKMRRRIKIVGRDRECRLRYLSLAAMDPRRSDIVNQPVFAEPAEDVKAFRQVEIKLPLLFSATTIRATAAEVFMQLLLLRKSNSLDNGNYSLIHAIELCADAAKADLKKNRLVVPTLLYRQS